MGEKTEEYQSKRVRIYDEPKHEYYAGYRSDIIALPPIIELFKTGGTTTNEKPDIDKEIDVERASSIVVQADTTHPSNTATSVDINIHATLNGVAWDTIPYAEMNLGDAEVKTMLINPGVMKLRIRIDTNNNTSYVGVKVKVRE